MRRNIFEENVSAMQQGCIFSGAIADGYKDCSVYGLIITPRCDIEQKKVSMIHYLPLIKYSDWKKHDLIHLYQFDAKKKKINGLKSQFETHNLPLHLLNIKYRMPKEELKKMFEEKNLKDQFYNDIITYWDLQDNNKCIESIQKWNNLDNCLSNLANGKNEKFLLLEHWNDSKEDFYVLNLTEIRHIQFDTALKLLTGVRANNIDTEKDDLRSQNNLSATYKILSKLTSPYIEYVCQKMSNAFFRIGIEDWQYKVTEKLKAI